MNKSMQNNKISQSNGENDSNEKKKHSQNAPIYDMSIIKDILKREDMQLLVNSDDLTTENYLKPMNKNADENSCDSNDTRYVLNKRKIDVTKFLIEIGAKLDYVSSGATGHLFRGDVIRDGKVIYQFAMKVAAYRKHASYGEITNTQRPENAEIMMLRTLSYFVVKNQTPHLILPIVTFYSDIKVFLSLAEYGYIKHDSDKYDKFIKDYKEGGYDRTVSILLSQWANRGDFLDFARKRYKNFKLIHWKVFFFQILSVLAVIQSKYPNFLHHDLKLNNVLVQKIPKTGKPWQYTICNKLYILPDIGYQLKLWDFDFACIEGVVDNIKTTENWTKRINVTPKKHQYYDIHYCFNTMLKFIPELVTDKKHVPQEMLQFVYRVVPEKYRDSVRVTKKGRLLTDDEYTTPKRLLEEDEFFTDFRY